MYSIGQFSKMTKTTIKTLRYYDKINLIKPAYTNIENGYRYYETHQLYELHKIISLKQSGFTIKEILYIINNNDIENILSNRKSEIIQQIYLKQEQLSKINNLIKERKEGFKMKYQTIIKDLPECIVYSKRMKVKDYNSYFQVIPEIGKEVSSLNPNLKCTIPPYCFIIYHDKEYKETDIDIEFCEAVEEIGRESESIKFKKMQSIKAVCVMHKGAYSELRLAYAYILKWIEENGYSIIGNARESYIDGIWNKEDESEWLTEIQIPVKKI